jgi:DNA primase
MSGRIPDSIVDRIIGESDIVAVISEFMSLKKSGKDFKGLCPFHQEKTPSFFVVPAKGFYHCFGCGKGGNVVNFIMEHERLEYPAALRYLAEKAGIEIPRTDAVGGANDRLFNALAVASAFFERSLFTSAGKNALEYLKNRGISEATARLFGLGFAPPGWDNLIKEASSKGVKIADLEAAGLAVKKEGYYDRFRGRIMVPIRTISGNVVGFGGRVLSGEEEPKYVNSPETSVYKKGRILYGLDVSRNDIRNSGEAVVVEGYFDLISLHQAGIKNVVAVSGTGFTDEQASLLGRYCQKTVLLFDSDSAGIRGAFRACGVLYNNGLEPHLVRLPKGFDPDSYVIEKGREDLSRLVAGAADIIDYVYQSLNGNFTDQSLSRQKKIIRALSELMSPVDDKLTKDLLSKKMFDRLDVDTRTLGIIGEHEKTEAPSGESPAVSGRDRFEREFLAILLSRPEFAAKAAGIVTESLFTEAFNARIYSAVTRFHNEGWELSVNRLSREVGNGDAGKRLREIAIRSENTDDSEDEFDNYLKRFRRISARKRLDELKGLIGKAEGESDFDKLEILTREFQNLKLEVDANDAKV